MSQESLAKLLADLHAERVRTWDPAALKVNVEQRAILVAEANPDAWIKVGDVVEPFDLKDVEGGDLTLKNLTSKGPAVLVFFRFAGCPACNIALPYYERALQPTLRALYTADEASRAAQRARGGSIGETTGTGTWELPQPTVVVIDRNQVVRFADVSPDWLVRTEVEPVIAAVRTLAAVPAH
jgi:peroxiredoxin